MKQPITVFAISLIAAAITFFGGCSYMNVDDIKAHSAQAWRKSGFEIVGYEGYQIGDFETPGGRVWYVVKSTNGSPTLFDGCLGKWGTEYHIYNLHALNAINPK